MCVVLACSVRRWVLAQPMRGSAGIVVGVGYQFARGRSAPLELADAIRTDARQRRRLWALVPALLFFVIYYHRLSRPCSVRWNVERAARRARRTCRANTKSPVAPVSRTAHTATTLSHDDSADSDQRWGALLLRGMWLWPVSPSLPFTLWLLGAVRKVARAVAAGVWSLP